MPEPFELNVAEAAEQVRNGSLSPVALAQSLLGRIDSLERLNAWITIDREDVLGAAQEREEQVAQGRILGPMHGVPVGLKDIYYTAGMKTTANSKVYADFVPSFDATSVRKMKEAGAIVLGKAMTTEFATSDPSIAVNPYNPDHTAGGSSSGSCVAVASRMCAVALGSQTAGSTVRPAAYNGIVGLKATYGRISRAGVIPVAWSLDHVGVLVRTVRDAALMLGVLAGYDPDDPSSSLAPVPDYMAALGRQQSPPRLGLMRQYFYDRCDDEVRAHTDSVVQKLASAGATVEEVEAPPSFAYVAGAHRVLSNTECAAYHEEVFRQRKDDYSPQIRANIEMGMLMPGVRYLQASRLRRVVSRELNDIASRYDALIVPTAPSEAPDTSTTGDPALQVPWTFAGMPTINVPSGLSANGLPLGVTLATGSLEEERMFAVSAWCEATLGCESGAGPVAATRLQETYFSTARF